MTGNRMAEAALRDLHTFCVAFWKSASSVERERSAQVLRALQQGGVFDAVAQAERTIVMPVIVDEHVIRRGSLAGRLECRMRFQQRLVHQQRVVRDAKYPDAPVVEI